MQDTPRTGGPAKEVWNPKEDNAEYFRRMDEHYASTGQVPGPPVPAMKDRSRRSGSGGNGNDASGGSSSGYRGTRTRY